MEPTTPSSSTPVAPNPVQPASPAPVVPSPQSANIQNTTPVSHSIITILLLIFLPLIGVIVMFIFTKWPKWVKAAVTFVFLLLPLLAIIFAIILIAINPAKQFGKANDTQRQSNVNLIMNAIGQYSVDNNGQLPDSISNLIIDTPTLISNEGADICADIVGAYMSSLPTDPSLESPDINKADCVNEYNTGYIITKDASGKITIAAPNAESGVVISVTR